MCEEIEVNDPVAVLRAELDRGQKVLRPKRIAPGPLTNLENFRLRASVDPAELLVGIRPTREDSRGLPEVGRPGPFELGLEPRAELLRLLRESDLLGRGILTVPYG